MKILGLDPGIARLGWAIIINHRSQSAVVASGCITTSLNEPEPSRLLSLHHYLQRLFTQYAPDTVAIESLFFATNAKTAISVGQARGVTLLVAAQNRTPVASYTPLEVKLTITGSGKADKKQVASMVIRLLRLNQTPEPDDVTDALALALTHAAMYKMKAISKL